MSARITLLGAALAALVSAPLPAAAQFTYAAPGTLQRAGGGAPRVGAGRVDSRNYAPGIRFPIENTPAYANSQIYGHGGYMGPGGGQCSAGNYQYPWYDNYCEERSWTMPMCPSGRGHQGQDIRPGTCEDSVHWVVASAAGTVSNVGSYSVYVMGDDGRRYDYLHMNMGRLAVSRGQRVTRGQRLGLVSDDFGGTSTTIHLHYNIRMNVSGVGTVYAPTYMALVNSYQELVGPPAWRAEFVRQSFPLASEPFELAPGEVVSGFFELRNTGSETWTANTRLGTSNPRDADSPLRAPDWMSGHRVTAPDGNVAPGEVGRFSFSVQAPASPGEYPQYFNLVEEGVSWFSDSGGPADDLYQIRVTVVAGRCPAGTSGTWTCEGAERVRCVDGTVMREPCPECSGGECGGGAPRDDDGDGHNTSVDCDDTDPSVYPGAPDECGDGVDQNCDGVDACGVDAGPGTDAGPGFDSGVPGVDAGDDPGIDPTGGRVVGGCGCRTGGGPAGGALLLLALVAIRRRAQST